MLVNVCICLMTWSLSFSPTKILVDELKSEDPGSNESRLGCALFFRRIQLSVLLSLSEKRERISIIWFKTVLLPSWSDAFLVVVLDRQTKTPRWPKKRNVTCKQSGPAIPVVHVPLQRNYDNRKWRQEVGGQRWASRIDHHSQRSINKFCQGPPVEWQTEGSCQSAERGKLQMIWRPNISLPMLFFCSPGRANRKMERQTFWRKDRWLLTPINARMQNGVREFKGWFWEDKRTCMEDVFKRYLPSEVWRVLLIRHPPSAMSWRHTLVMKVSSLPCSSRLQKLLWKVSGDCWWREMLAETVERWMETQTHVRLAAWSVKLSYTFLNVCRWAWRIRIYAHWRWKKLMLPASCGACWTSSTEWWEPGVCQHCCVSTHCSHTGPGMHVFHKQLVHRVRHSLA